MIGWGYALLILFVACDSHAPSIKLMQPLQSALYFLGSTAETTSVIVMYRIFDLSTSSLTSPHLCISLMEDLTHEELVPSTCFEVGDGLVERVFSGLPRGTYNLTLSLQADNLVGNNEIVTSLFYIKSIEELLPTVSIVDSTGSSQASGMNVVTSAGLEKSTDASVEYSLGATLLDMSELEICVDLTDLSIKSKVLGLTCVPATQRVLTFQALNLGTYSLSLTLATKLSHEKKEPRILYQKSEIIHLIHIRSITDIDMMPYIVLEEKLSEIGLHSQEEKIDFKVEFTIHGIPSATSQVQVCARVDLIQIETEDQSTLDTVHLREENVRSSRRHVMVLSCIPPEESSLILAGISAGRYDVILSLRLSSAPYTSFDSTVKHINLETRIFTEFLPSYKWQPLHAWHTIPTGIQTRLIDWHCYITYLIGIVISLI